jgi:preprotein translocase subunit YajC
LLLLLVVPLFLSMRRQKKAMAEMRQLQDSLIPGDRVVTTSGLHGTVVDIDDEDTIDLEIAPDVVTTWVRAAVREKIDLPAEDTVDDESAATDLEPVEARKPST